MAKRKTKQKRIGANEKKLIGSLVRKFKRYSIYRNMKNKRETEFNKLLFDYARQKPTPLQVRNKNIPSPELVEETFRPEFYLANAGTKFLCAVECKKLSDHNAKSRWKEGLSQALIYATVYKAVVLLLFDFTRQGVYANCFGRGKTAENRFAAKLRKVHKISIVVLAPID